MNTNKHELPFWGELIRVLSWVVIIGVLWLGVCFAAGAVAGISFAWMEAGWLIARKHFFGN